MFLNLVDLGPHSLCDARRQARRARKFARQERHRHGEHPCVPLRECLQMRIGEFPRLGEAIGEQSTGEIGDIRHEDETIQLT